MLRLQGEVADLTTGVDEMGERLEAAAGTGRGRLFRLDSSPIWRPAPGAGGPGGLVTPWSGSTESVIEVLRPYALAVVELLAIESFMFGVLLVLLLWLRKKAAGYLRDEDETVRGLGFAIRRPVSTAILLAVVGTAVGSVVAPIYVVSPGWFALLIPLLRVVPGLSPPGIKPYLWALAALYVGSVAVAFVPALATATRTLAVTLSMAATTALILYGRRLVRRKSGSRWRQAAQFGVRAATALAVVTGVAEVIGATGLSRYLAGAMLSAAYAAAALYGALTILRGLLTVILRALSTHGSPVRQMPSDLGRAMVEGLTWLAAFLYAVLVLRAFEAWEVLLGWGAEILRRRIEIGALVFTVGSAFAFVGVLVATGVVSRVIRLFLTAGLQGRLDLARGTTEAVSKLVHYTILTVGVMVALGASGLDLNKFTVLAGALGVGVGLGLQNVVSNFVSGLILLFERLLKVGDQITVGDSSGEVKDIGIRATTIATWDGADVIVPNAGLISGTVTNWTLTDNRRRSEVSVGVAYGTDPRAVIRILQETALAHPEVLRGPEPAALFVGFGDSTLDFSLRYWTLLEHTVGVGSQLRVALSDNLAAAGIDIPFPQRELHIRPGNLPVCTPPPPAQV